MCDGFCDLTLICKKIALEKYSRITVTNANVYGICLDIYMLSICMLNHNNLPASGNTASNKSPSALLYHQ